MAVSGSVALLCTHLFGSGVLSATMAHHGRLKNASTTREVA